MAGAVGWGVCVWVGPGGGHTSPARSRPLTSRAQLWPASGTLRWLTPGRERGLSVGQLGRTNRALHLHRACVRFLQGSLSQTDRTCGQVSTRRPPCAPTVMRELTRVLRAPAARGVVPQVCLRVDSLGISATFLRGWIHLFTHRGRPEGPAPVATLYLHNVTGCRAEGTGDGGDGQIGFR